MIRIYATTRWDEDIKENNNYKLCKIRGFQGDGFRKCRPFGYKNPFPTSEETYYISTTGLSQLMLCKVWSFQDRDYEEYRLLGCGAHIRLVTTDVSEEYIASVLAVGRISELETLAVLSKLKWSSLLVTANVSSLLIVSTLKMEATCSSETSALTRPRQRHILEDGILHSHRRENLTFYIALTGWSL
jgi:hypothetical protein